MYNHSKARTVAFALAVIIGLSALSIIPVSYASTPSLNIYSSVEQNAHSLEGYDGNSTVYMTKYTDDTNVSGVNYSRAAQNFREEYVSGYQTSQNNTYGTPNSLYLVAGGNTEQVSYLSGAKYFLVDIPIAFMGAFRNSSRSTSVINNVNLSIHTSSPYINSSNAGDLYTTLRYQYGSGFNTTGPLDINSAKYRETLVSLALDGLGVLTSIAGVPCVGYAIAAGSAAYTIYGASTGHSPTMVSSFNGNGTGYEYFAVTNGSLAGSGNNTFFNDVFGSGVPLYLNIYPSQFATPVTYTINATSYMGTNYEAAGYNSDGTAIHLSEQIQAVPASEISGTVYLGSGHSIPDANHYVYLVDDHTGASYKVMTNSAGNYRFFAQPETDYTLYATYNSPSNGTSLYHPELSRNSLNFTTGSPGGLEYETLNVGGIIEGHVDGPSGSLSHAAIIVENSAGSSETVYTNSNGNYRASIGNTSTYSLYSVESGYTTSNTYAVVGNYLGVSYQNFTISYANYPITFQETGLSSGTSWSVSLNGTSETSTSSVISFSEHMGTYNYVVGSLSGYDISPKSGTITVTDQSISQNIKFTGTGTITFHESGLPTGASWTANAGSYSGSSSGSSISISGVPDGSYSYSIPNVDVKMSNGDTDVYSANPSGGTVSTGGSVSTTFSLSEVISPPSGGGGGGGGTGCVNGTTEILLANGTYTQAQNITIGTHVMTYNTTSHTYSSETVEDIFYSHHSRQYTVNGYLQASEYQPILTNHGYVEIRNLTKQDRIFNIFTGKYGKITDITVQNGNYTFYDFNIPPNHDFIAWEYVVYDLTIKP